MALTGVVTARREAILRLEVLGAGSSEAWRTEIEAVVDTGFTGYLALPGAIVEELELPAQRRSEAILADGSIVALEVHRAKVLWEGEERDAEVLALEGDPLVGMSLLYGHEVRLRVVEGGSVVVERFS